MSVCILTAGRRALLDKCLASLAAQRDPPSFEVLVGADRDPEIVALVEAHGLDATVIEATTADDRPLPPADKRNLLIERARGELLLFLDDDVLVLPHLLRRLEEGASAHPDTSVFGGPNLTPTGSSPFQQVQGAVLGSLVGSGPARRRWGAHPAGAAREPYLTLCNLAVRNTEIVPFVPGLYTGEECAMLNELRRRGDTVRYDPELAVYHERRPTWRAFARQVFGYGRGRGRVVRRSLGNLRPWMLLPLLLLAYVVSLPLLVQASPLTLVPLMVYAIGVAAQALKIRRSLPSLTWVAARAALLIMCVHVCYGAGLIVGLGRRHRLPSTTPARWSNAIRA